MPPFVVRRSERIDYRVPVTLFAVRDNVAPVIARSVDVSEGGMRVYAPIPVPVGAPVRCEISLDGRSATLEGRVAWLADQSPEAAPGLGMGIRFETLSREDSGVLRHIVARATEGYMPAELELSGVHAPVAARAMPTSDGARISASLPWLRRGAPVGVRFVGESGGVRGQITDAVLRELPSGGRRLQIDVEADTRPRSRRDTRYGDALDFERARRITPNENEDDSIDADGVARNVHVTHATRKNTWLAFALGAALGGGAVALSMTLLVRSPEQSALRASDAASHVAKAVEEPSLPRSAARKEASSAAPLVPAATPVEEAPTSEAIPSAMRHTAPAPSTNATPSASTDGNTTIVRIPFRGTLEGMNARIWAEPHALALDLPHGQTELDAGRYALNAGTASFVRVQRRSDRTLLRIGLARGITDHVVALHGQLLEVRMTSREVDNE
jgi:hypothetical protein